MIRTMLVTSMLLAAATGCGKGHQRGGAVDIRGDSPEEAADEVVEAVCDWTARCGEPSVECGGSTGGDIRCTATIEDVTFAECYDDLHPGALADFRCAELTEEQARIVNECINAITSQRCVSMAELEEYAAALEAGEEPPSPLAMPPECGALRELFRDCPDA